MTASRVSVGQVMVPTSSGPGDLLVGDGGGGWLANQNLPTELGQELRLTALGWLPAPVEQAAWFVDSVSGRDTNDGASSAAPLRTLAELARRLSGATITAATVITLSGNFAAEPLALDITIASGVLVTIQAAVTIADSGALTAVTAADPPTNTRGQVTDAAQVFTDKSRIKITSGAIAGSIGYVTRVIAPDNVNVSAWALLANPLSSQLPTIGTPAIGNTYDVETLGATIGRVDVRARGTGRLVLKDLIVSPATSGAHRATSDSSQLANVMFWGCLFAAPQSALFYDSIACFISCAFDVTMVIAKTVATMRATTNRGILKADLSGEVQFARSCNFDGGFLWVSGHSEASITGSPGDVEFSDVVADAAVTVDPGSIVDANQSLTTLLWGTDNTISWAFLVRSLGGVAYQVLPVIAGGSVADVSLGGVNTAYGALPAVTAANNAAMVVRV